MSRRRWPVWLMVEAYLVLTLFIGLPLLLVSWNHHQIILNSPVLPGETAAKQWLARTSREEAPRCLAASLIRQSYRIAGTSDWAAKFECNDRWGGVRAVLALFGPGLLSFGFLGFAFRRR